jgi:hypothetical protein
VRGAGAADCVILPRDRAMPRNLVCSIVFPMRPEAVRRVEHAVDEPIARLAQVRTVRSNKIADTLRQYLSI